MVTHRPPRMRNQIDATGSSVVRSARMRLREIMLHRSFHANLQPDMCQRIAPNLTTKIFTLLFLAVVAWTRAATLPAGFIDVVVASGFTNVSSMAIAPDGRIFVCQQNGLVRVVKNGALLPASFVSLG